MEISTRSSQSSPVAALTIPLATGWVYEFGDLFDWSFYASCALIPYYFLAALTKWLCAGCCGGREQTAATTAGLLLLLLAAPADAQPRRGANDPARTIAERLAPTPPVKLPADAVIIPFDNKNIDGLPTPGKLNAEKVLVPYAKYVELWNRAFPEKKIDARPPATPYALAGAAYTATLDGDQYLSLSGHLDIDVFTDKAVQVPLHLDGGVLVSATLDGAAAKLQLIETGGQSLPQQPSQQANQRKGAPPARVWDADLGAAR